jgi:chromosome segregation ATPase
VTTLQAALADAARKAESAARAQRTAESARDDLREKLDLEARHVRRADERLQEAEDANAALASKVSALKVRDASAAARLAALKATNEDLEEQLVRLFSFCLFF